MAKKGEDLPGSPFLYVACQAGAEAVLKKEFAREHPDLKFAYSRPGYLTFKSTGKKITPETKIRSTFGRISGLSLGKVKTAQELIELIGKALPKEHPALRLQIWERDRYLPGDEPLGFVQDSGVASLRAKILAQASGARALPKFLPKFLEGAIAQTGDWICDVAIVEPEEFWVGLRAVGPGDLPWPGGRAPVSLPKEAPSRSYLKIEEALLVSNAPLKSGDTAVEIGSAPGGACFALLQRGLRVVGIDPAEMDRGVTNHRMFRQIQNPVASVLREDLPDEVQWLLLDMNVEPRVSLFAVDRLASRMRDCLLGVFLTVKLNRWEIADEIPEILKHVRAMGMVRVRALQLSQNRREISISGLTRKGLARGK